MSTTSTAARPPIPEWVFVTPELAREWLGFNTHNRNIRPEHVDNLAAGYIDYHPNPILRNCDGTLLDGQHRLTAIAQRGVGAWALVITGVPTEMQNHIDTGIVRTLADVLTLNGYQNCNALAATIRHCLIWERNPQLTHTSGRIMPDQGLCYIEQHPYLQDYITDSISLLKRCVGIVQPTAPRLTVCRIAIERAYGDAFTDSFLRSLILGIGIAEDSVIFATRRRLLSISSGKDHAIGLDPHKNARMAMWMVLRAAVAHRNDEPMKKIVYRNDTTPMPILLDGTLNKEKQT